MVTTTDCGSEPRQGAAGRRRRRRSRPMTPTAHRRAPWTTATERGGGRDGCGRHLHRAGARLRRRRAAHPHGQVTDTFGFTGWDEYEQQAFVFGGFQFPIRPVKPWYRAPAGARFGRVHLGGRFGLNVLMPGYPKVSKCGAVATVAAAGQFKFTLGEYQYLWKTPKKPKGQAILTLTLDDGTSHEVHVTIT